MSIVKTSLSEVSITDWLPKAEEYRLAKQSLQSNGAKCIDIDIEEPEHVTVGDTNIGELMYTIISGLLSLTPRGGKMNLLTYLSGLQDQEAKSDIDRFLQFFEYSKVRTLNDLVKFNDEHADVEFDKGPSTILTIIPHGGLC